MYPCIHEQSDVDMARNGSLSGFSKSNLWQPSAPYEDGETYVESNREHSAEAIDIDEVLSPTTIPSSQDLGDGLEQKPAKKGVLGKLRQCFAPKS